MHGKRILLIVTGGIAAYKSLELVRRLREAGAAVRCVLSSGGERFVTPLSLAALSEDKVYGELFSLTDESEMGHIRLSREADLLVVAPATADILAKMSAGLADDLASTVLLATDKQVLVAPAMNVRMWQHPATRANIAQLAARGVRMVGPNEGEMACGEYGPGRMAEPDEILTAIRATLGSDRRLAGRRAIVTSGPTHEAIDPVRYIANRSSGRQGHAIAAALAELGAATTLISGPTQVPDPPGVEVVRIESAREMLGACLEALPVDLAVCVAAVSDWRAASPAGHKLKKNGAPPKLDLAENPDILRTLSDPQALGERGNARPRLVVGFAAETDRVAERGRDKLSRKGCDWILANDVSGAANTFGGEWNTVHLITAEALESWPRMRKDEVAARLAERIAAVFDGEAVEEEA